MNTTVRRYITGITLLLQSAFYCCAVQAQQDDFPKPSGPASVLPKTFSEKIQDTPVEIFFETDDHMDIFEFYFNGQPDAAENKTRYTKRRPDTNEGKVSTGHPLFHPDTGLVRFIDTNDVPKAFLRRKTYWENVWSQGMSAGQKLNKKLKVSIGASKESVNAFTSVVADVKLNFQDSSGHAETNVSHQSLTMTVEEQRIEEESLDLSTAPGERATFTMWQFIEELSIVDKQGNPIHFTKELWRLYPSVDQRNRDVDAVNQAQGTYASPAIVQIRGQRYLDKAVMPGSL